VGLISKKRRNEYLKNEEGYKNFVKHKLKKIKTKSFFNKKNEPVNLKENKTIFHLLSRPDINTNTLVKIKKSEKDFYERAKIEIKYKGYVAKQLREINKTKKQNSKIIPKTFDYNSVNGLSNEVKEKLNQKTPRTIGSASKIEGVTPAAINLILIYLKKSEIVEQNA